MKITTKQLRGYSLGATILVVLLALYTPLTVLLSAIGKSWDGIWGSALQSAALALCAGGLATLFGATAALILWEETPRRVKHMIESAVFVAANIPSIIVALAVLILLPDMPSYPRLLTAMVLSLTPYTARYILEDLNTMPPYTVDAMRALGAGGIRSVLSGILPYAKHSIPSALLYGCARALTEIAVLSLLCGANDAFLPLRIIATPLSDTAFPAALMLCALAMFLFDRARSLHGRR